jgi:hydrogenase maturation protease
MRNKTLIAGIGNIFLGDDAFGVEVAQRLQRRPLPDGVQVVDFGIRGFDLAFALMDNWDAVILVDAMARGGDPGCVYAVVPDPQSFAPEASEAVPAVDGHGMHPLNVLRMVRQMGGDSPPVLLIACEPLTLGGDEGQMGVSPPVSAAVDVAIQMIHEILKDPESLRRACEPTQDFHDSMEAKAS